MVAPRKTPTPINSKEGGKYRCWYYDKFNKRVKGVLNTNNKGEADKICEWLQKLSDEFRSERLIDIQDDFINANVRAFELFFYEEKVIDKISVDIKIEHDINDNYLDDLGALYAENARLKAIVDRQQNVEFELKQLKKDRLSRIISAGNRIPDTKQFFFIEYIPYIKTKMKKTTKDAGHHLETVKNFLKDSDWPNLADIEKADIRKWLFNKSNDSSNPLFKASIDINKRSNRYRRELTRFFNHVEEEYDIPSKVPKALSTIKNKITFNDSTEIKMMIDKMHLRQDIAYPDYWQTMVAVLAWTGCLSKALWGITHNDLLYKDGEINAIRLRYNEFRDLKNPNRDRVIEIHPLLKVYLINHLNSRYPGKTLVFPNIPKVIHNWNKYKSKEKAWNSDTFSKRLKGETKDGRWIPGAIDKSYICNRSLRRTFAMLLINQAGMTFEQVASILGNNPDTVREWYAEIDESSLSFKHVDFSKKLQIFSLQQNLLKEA